MNAEARRLVDEIRALSPELTAEDAARLPPGVFASPDEQREMKRRLRRLGLP